MGKTPEEKIQRWLSAAGQTGKSDSVRQRVVAAGEFLENTGRMDERAATACLTGIDFSKAVEVVRLPDRLFVQYVKQHLGVWFTDTGLTPDQIGLAEAGRTRKLYRPSGLVHALRSTARSIRDDWTVQVPKTATSAERRRLATLTRGGGTQYVVPEKFRMIPK